MHRQAAGKLAALKRLHKTITLLLLDEGQCSNALSCCRCHGIPLVPLGGMRNRVDVAAEGQYSLLKGSIAPRPK